MYLGIDTSNYTTSVAVFDGKKVSQVKQMLKVKSGERGLRQSDAVFQHTLNMRCLFDELDIGCLDAVGVSTCPRNVEGSYMPCFLVGESVAVAVAKTNGLSLYKTSHQVGHILSALYSVGLLKLIKNDFIAFHLSGGTTEALLVKPDKDEIIKAEIIACSADLKAGQAVDRTGVLLGLNFPCGKELDKLSLQSDRVFNIRPSMKALDCSLSGVENKAKQMIQNGEKSEDVAKFVFDYISCTVSEMLKRVIEKYGNMPIVFSGGVSSNSVLRSTITESFNNAFFAESEFSLDNAAGTAIFAYLKDKGI